MVELVVVAADILTRPCDLLLLKHADGFSGVDGLVAERLGFSSAIAQGKAKIVEGRGIDARQVLYIGVGPLFEFRYPQIRKFARNALELSSNGSGNIEVICTPIHGPGYGLDEREAFLSLVAGFLDGIESGRFPRELKRIEIVDLKSNVVERLSKILSNYLSEKRKPAPQPASVKETSFVASERNQGNLASFGSQSEEKPRLFVAMPFSAEHSDVWEIAIQEACQAAGILCERMDEQAYTGNIIAEITDRLKNGAGVLAVLDDANPNVFLEVGFAWGAGKPTVLITKKGNQLPFDVRGQKCVEYTSIANLRSLLTLELVALNAKGFFRG